MATHDISEGLPVLSGSVIKKYRRAENLTQEQLAALVGLDARTIRGYELGERQITNVQTAKKIAAVLHIPSAESGLHEIASTVFADPNRAFDEVWHLVATANFIQARSTIQVLQEHLKQESSDQHGGRTLAYAYFLAGHIEAITCPTYQVDQAQAYFQAMEPITYGDHTLINLSLTYQGDMLRRVGKIDNAIHLLEQAWATTSLASSAAKGNNQQLLARAYFRQRDIPRFEAAINRSIGFGEEVAMRESGDCAAGSMRVSYNLCAVYEEQARCLAHINNIKASLSSLDKAEAALPNEQRWQMNLKATRGEVLIRKAMLRTTTNVRDLLANDDFQQGVSLLSQVTELAKRTGHNRLLRRIHEVPRYLNQKSLYLSQAADIVRDALENGGIQE